MGRDRTRCDDVAIASPSSRTTRSAGEADLTITESPAFTLEDFCWQWPDRLEVTGQWRGVEPASIGDAVLLIAVGGDTRTLNARGPRVPAERSLAGHRWRASFRYTGDSARITGAELRAAPGFIVTLPPPSARRRRFDRRVLDVRVEGEAAVAAIRDGAEARQPVNGVEPGRQAAVPQRAENAEAIRRLRHELHAERDAGQQVAQELERQRRAHAGALADVKRMGLQLRAMKESGDQVRAELELERERFRLAREELERARRREAAEVERLSGMVRSVRAAMERTGHDHRAALRRLAEDLDTALDRVETLAGESGGHTDVARRALAERAPADARPVVHRRLEVIAAQTRELTELAGALRRRLARMEAPGDASGARRNGR